MIIWCKIAKTQENYEKDPRLRLQTRLPVYILPLAPVPYSTGHVAEYQ